MKYLNKNGTGGYSCSLVERAFRAGFVRGGCSLVFVDGKGFEKGLLVDARKRLGSVFYSTTNPDADCGCDRRCEKVGPPQQQNVFFLHSALQYPWPHWAIQGYRIARRDEGCFQSAAQVKKFQVHYNSLKRKVRVLSPSLTKPKTRRSAAAR